MAHSWETLPRNSPTDLLRGQRRQCKNCGAVQERISNTSWGRVVGYFWWPKVGRCKQ